MGNAEYMGTHPIFESDFDCLTDFVSDMRAELCHFSGLKIHPGHGMNHCKADGKVIRLLSSKNAALYHNKTNPVSSVGLFFTDESTRKESAKKPPLNDVSAETSK